MSWNKRNNRNWFHLLP